jgi:hypothetical protein
LTKAKSTFKDLKNPFPRISIAKREGKVVKIAIYIYCLVSILSQECHGKMIKIFVISRWL